MNTVMYLYESGAVSRYHTEPFPSQSVGQHTWGAMMLADQLFRPHLPREVSDELLRALLYHDTAERLTGDTPAPAKWVNPNLNEELDRAETEVFNQKQIPRFRDDDMFKLLMKAADYGEALLYCASQLHAGNRYAEKPFQRLRKTLRDMACRLPDFAYDDETEWRGALNGCGNAIRELVNESMRLAYKPVNYCWEDER